MEKISKILIANRGEVVCRIAKTLEKMGIASVSIYTESDRNSFFISSTDENVLIKSHDAHSGYLDQRAIIEAAQLIGADAIHPGFGFLAENANFAKNVRKSGLRFIGPSEEAILEMGDKLRAKRMAIASNVNIIPGLDEAIPNMRRALDVVKKIGGYPVMVKAAAGGGGKGIRVAHNPQELEEAFGITVSEAESSFKNGSVFIEKFIVNPHHIEIQVVADKHGNIVCLGERECSIQRRYQKIIEETPSVLIDEPTRARMYAQCVSLVRSIGYYSVGTVEFVVNDQREFFFLEMNTRLQVEHTITEMVTGLDIVEIMVNIEEGYPLEFTQDDVTLSGSAIEARIYAEDAENDFTPSIGKITTYIEPIGMDNIRIETGITSGSDISPYYDPMIVKLCAHGLDRATAIANLQRALGEFVVYGKEITTNMVFLEFILRNKKFLAGDTSTSFISTECSPFKYSAPGEEERNIMLSAIAYRFVAAGSYTSSSVELMATTKNFSGTIQYESIDDRSCIINIGDWSIKFNVVESLPLRIVLLTSGGKNLCVKIVNPRVESGDMHYYGSYGGYYLNCRMFDVHVGKLFKVMLPPKNIGDDPSLVISQMSGMVVNVFVEPKAHVKKGERLLCVEAMKMQNILYAKINAIVDEVRVSNGDLVNKGDIMITLSPAD